MTTGSPGASAHLQIPLHEYDARIRTFVPYYDEMLDEVAAAVRMLELEAPLVVDLGIGTGALAERCLEAAPGASLVGIDADPGMLSLARARLKTEDVELRVGSFVDVALPACQLIVASFLLHHIAAQVAKQALYRRCRDATSPGGALVLADCFLPCDDQFAEEGMRKWHRHLEQFYSAAESTRLLEAWGQEDTFFRLNDEMQWLGEAGFRPEVLWRRDLFAVLLCR
jgi:SAM-dependent methyltransferase